MEEKIHMVNLPKDFNWQEYLFLNPDLGRVGIHTEEGAKRHWLRFGRNEHRQYLKEKPVANLAYSPLQIKNTTVKRNQTGNKVLVLFHCFYLDVIDEICSYIKNLNNIDIYINVVSNGPDDPDEMTKRLESQLYGYNFKIFKQENRGRDIGGFVSLLSNIDLKEYSKAFLVHTKKSPHLKENTSKNWRKNLLSAILLDKSVANQTLKLLDTHGIVCTSKHISRSIGSNKEYFEDILSKLSINNREIEFLAGTMFACKTDILIPIKECLEFSNFEKGNYQNLNFNTDGQLAHAVERVFFNICKELKYPIYLV